MEFSFSKNTEEFLKIIAKTAQTNNVRVFFVGGAVRDSYLKKEIKDIDLILEGNAIEFSRKLPSEIMLKSQHKDFSTVKLKYCDKDIDIASTRTEYYPDSGCLPVVDKIGVNIKEDVKRRDFTVNSLYSEIKIENDKLKYELIDLVNGIQDIDKKILKSLHKKSYIDDPTRILRGLNFKYRFGFDFSLEDKNLIKDCINNLNLEKASQARILEVFKKTLSNEFQDEIFKEIIENKYYKLLFQADLNIDFNVLEKTAECFLLNQEQKANFYCNVLRQYEAETPEFNDKIQKYKFYSKLNEEKKAYLFYQTKDNDILFYSKIKVFLKGKNLIKLGYSKGKYIGEILDKLLLEKLENPKEFNDSKDEINWVRAFFPVK